MRKTKEILKEIHAERKRQHKLWGEQNLTPSEFYLILAEEVGEVATALQEMDLENYRVELTQVAAVAVQMIEALDRQAKAMGRFRK